MTTDVPSWRANNHTKRTSGCRACLPDLETTRPENLPPKEKVIRLSADTEKANKRSDRVDLRGKWRIPSVNLRPIQLVFFCPFYRSSTLTSRSSTLDTLIFPRKKHNRSRFHGPNLACALLKVGSLQIFCFLELTSKRNKCCWNRLERRQVA